MNETIFNLLKPEYKQELQNVDKPIYLLLKEKYVVDNNKRFMKMYNRLSYFYDFAEKLLGKMKIGQALGKMRSELISKLEWKDNLTVLAVSIGTGRDLQFIPKSIDINSLNIAGLDISLGMLKRSYKKFGKKYNLTLFNGAAEELPFIDNSFDIVFHVGGINFFSDKCSAIKEMIRVAKPGTKLMIGDETPELIEFEYKKSRFFKQYFKKLQFDLKEVEECVPGNVKEKKMEFLWDNKFYCLTFRK